MFFFKSSLVLGKGIKNNTKPRFDFETSEFEGEISSFSVKFGGFASYHVQLGVFCWAVEANDGCTHRWRRWGFSLLLWLETLVCFCQWVKPRMMWTSVTPAATKQPAIRRRGMFGVGVANGSRASLGSNVSLCCFSQSLCFFRLCFCCFRFLWIVRIRISIPDLEVTFLILNSC